MLSWASVVLVVLYFLVFDTLIFAFVAETLGFITAVFLLIYTYATCSSVCSMPRCQCHLFQLLHVKC